jgi:hypothetical protein
MKVIKIMADVIWPQYNSKNRIPESQIQKSNREQPAYNPEYSTGA